MARLPPILSITFLAAALTGCAGPMAEEEGVVVRYYHPPEEERGCIRPTKCITPPGASNDDPPLCDSGCIWSREKVRCEEGELD